MSCRCARRYMGSVNEVFFQKKLVLGVAALHLLHAHTVWLASHVERRNIKCFVVIAMAD